MRFKVATANKIMYYALGRLATVWNHYAAFVKLKTSTDRASTGRQDITFWREKLFTNFITFLIPISFFALIPGVTMGFVAHIPAISYFDLLIVSSIIVSIVGTPFKLAYRKAFVFLMLYGLALMLIYYLGYKGPGLIYLLAISVFVTLTCPARVAYYTIGINFIICLAFGLAIGFKRFDTTLNHDYEAGAWIASSSNVVFLSWVSVLLISSILNRLDETNLKEYMLQIQLKQQIIENANHNILLQESEALYKSLFSLSPSPKLVFDAQTLQFLQVNNAAARVYGFAETEFTQLHLNDLKADQDPTDFIGSFLVNLKENQNIRFITKHRRKTGDTFPVELFCNYIPFKGREAILFIANDITELLIHTKEIEQQNKQLMEIAFMQSHIVRAPLARLLGLIMLLKSADATSDEKPLVLDYLFKSANELDTVIKNISDKILPDEKSPGKTDTIKPKQAIT